MSRKLAQQDFTQPGADVVVQLRKSWWQRLRESFTTPRCGFCGQPLWKCLNQSALCFGSGR